MRELHLSRRFTLQLIGGTSATAFLASYCFGQGDQPGPLIATGDRSDIRSDGRNDDSRALQTAIDRISANGGGELLLRAGAVTFVDGGLLLRENVTLNLHGGTLLIRLSETNAVGVRLRSGATLKNGAIKVRSHGAPSLQGAAHAPVVVGPLYGDGGSPERRSADDGARGWTIRDLVLSTDKNADAGEGNRIGAPAIQIMGGAHQGLIENIEVPDSEYMVGGIHLDWGTVGPISSSTIPANRVLFERGGGFTTHPHDIDIRNIRIGRLLRPFSRAGGTFGVRLSGVYNIRVSDVAIESVTDVAFLHTAGDLGFEFAEASVRSMACRGIHISNGEVADASTSYLIWTDSYADNVGREAQRGYRPMRDPIHTTDIRFENIRGTALDPRRANFGVRVNHQRGGQIIDCIARGYKRGFYIDEQVDGLTLIRPVALDSAEHGISVEHPSRPPRNVVIENPVARRNGSHARDTISSGVLIGQSENVLVHGGEAPSTGSQVRGIRITPQARNARVTGNVAGLISRE